VKNEPQKINNRPGQSQVHRRPSTSLNLEVINLPGPKRQVAFRRETKKDVV